MPVLGLVFEEVRASFNGKGKDWSRSQITRYSVQEMFLDHQMRGESWGPRMIFAMHEPDGGRSSIWQKICVPRLSRGDMGSRKDTYHDVEPRSGP